MAADAESAIEKRRKELAKQREVREKQTREEVSFEIIDEWEEEFLYLGRELI